MSKKGIPCLCKRRRHEIKYRCRFCCLYCRAWVNVIDADYPISMAWDSGGEAVKW